MPESLSKPRFLPVLISLWTAILLLVFVLGPTSRAASAWRATAPLLASLTGVLVLGGFVAAIWVAFGAARLRSTPVRIALVVLIGCPALLIAKTLITGYFTAWFMRFVLVMVVINGFCAWYLLRSAVRGFWINKAVALYGRTPG